MRFQKKLYLLLLIISTIPQPLNQCITQTPDAIVKDFEHIERTIKKIKLAQQKIADIKQDIPLRALIAGAADAQNQALATIECIVLDTYNSKNIDRPLCVSLKDNSYDGHLVFFNLMQLETSIGSATPPTSKLTTKNLLESIMDVYDDKISDKLPPDSFPDYLDIAHIILGTNRGGGHLIVHKNQFDDLLSDGKIIEGNANNNILYGTRTDLGKKTFFPLQNSLAPDEPRPKLGGRPTATESEKKAAQPIIELIMNMLRNKNYIIAQRESLAPGSTSGAKSNVFLMKSPTVNYYMEIIKPPIEPGKSRSIQVITAYPIFHVIEWRDEWTTALETPVTILEHFHATPATDATRAYSETPLNPIRLTPAQLINLVSEQKILQTPALYTMTKDRTPYEIYDIASQLSRIKDATGTPLTIVEEGIYLQIPKALVTN